MSQMSFEIWDSAHQLYRPDFYDLFFTDLYWSTQNLQQGKDAEEENKKARPSVLIRALT